MHSALIILLAQALSLVSLADIRTFLYLPSLLILYYLCVSLWLQRSRHAGVAMAQYTPPEDMSPGQIRYLFTGDSDHKADAAVLVYLASRGIISMEPIGAQFSITALTSNLPDDLPEEERAAFDAMFRGTVQYKSVMTDATFEQPAAPKDNFLLNPLQGNEAVELGLAIHRALREQMEHKYFTRNQAFVLPAVTLSIFLAVWDVSRFQQSRLGEPAPPFLGMLVVTLNLVALIALINYLPRADELLRGRIHSPEEVRYLVGGLYLYMLVVIFLYSDTQIEMLALVLVVVPNLVLPPRFLRTPTPLGRARMDEVEGFRKFLAAVDLDKFHRLLQPDKASSLSTVNVAYALAFDLKDVWADYLSVCHLEPGNALPVTSQQIAYERATITFAKRFACFLVAWGAYALYATSDGTFSGALNVPILLFITALFAVSSWPPKFT
jgi:hypothetical protein